MHTAISVFLNDRSMTVEFHVKLKIWDDVPSAVSTCPGKGYDILYFVNSSNTQSVGTFRISFNFC